MSAVGMLQFIVLLVVDVVEKIVQGFKCVEVVINTLHPVVAVVVGLFNMFHQYVLLALEVFAQRMILGKLAGHIFQGLSLKVEARGLELLVVY